MTDAEPEDASALMALQAAWQRAYAGDPTADLAPTLGPAHPDRRGGSDALAAWQRWHPRAVDDLFSDAEWPLYAILERARVETLAGRDLPGMALNLADVAPLAPTGGRATSLYGLARRVFDGPLSIANPDETAAREGPESPCLNGFTEDPGRFGPEQPAVRDQTGVLGALLRRLRGGLGLRAAMDAGADDRTDAPRRVRPGRAPSAARIAEHLEQARAILADADGFAERILPLVRELTLAAADDQSPLTAAARRQGSISPPAMPGDAEFDPPDGAQTNPDDEAETTDTPAGAVDGITPDRHYPGYATYSRRWDQLLDAAQLYQPSDALNLRQIPEPDQRQARRLALRLQRRLVAARLRRWSFDQDEGRLDSRRLARLLTRRSPYAVFRQEDEAPVPEACVTLLVDQSGSMRGLPQRLTAQAIDLAACTLEICGIRCEVLGYTTRFGSDNPLVRAWRAAGEPPRPGRLNAPRHLIYKGADQRWRRRRPYLGLLLREGLGRENLDGEALDWAARRLRAWPEPRKILIVLCDAAPYDEATVSANGRRFLDDHLRAVIAAVEASPIHLAAIGAGQAVGRFYRHALTLRQPADVADRLFEHLGDLLTRPHR